METTGLIHSIGGFALPGRCVGMTQRWIEAVVSARFLVARLGETVSPSWWRSDATDPASQRFLERLYPRTAAAASLETASLAAMREHDAHIGVIDVYHLFRLPTIDEMALHQYMLSSSGIAQIRRLASLSTSEASMNALRELAHGDDILDAQGPLMCGSLATLHTNSTLQRICAAYFIGLSRQHAVYPYLVKGDAA